MAEKSKRQKNKKQQICKTNANGEQRIARRQHYNQHNPVNN